MFILEGIAVLEKIVQVFAMSWCLSGIYKEMYVMDNWQKHILGHQDLKVTSPRSRTTH